MKRRSTGGPTKPPTDKPLSEMTWQEIEAELEKMSGCPRTKAVTRFDFSDTEPCTCGTCV